MLLELQPPDATHPGDTLRERGRECARALRVRLRKVRLLRLVWWTVLLPLALYIAVTTAVFEGARRLYAIGDIPGLLGGVLIAIWFVATAALFAFITVYISHIGLFT